MKEKKASPLISFIVPVYNASSWIDSCVSSVINQEINDFELLLVDDGSTDSSYETCMVWSQKDKRIRTIHKNNGGVSSARNVGIHNAKGKYIIFLDADDAVEKDLLKKIDPQIDTVDMLHWGYQTMDEKGCLIEKPDLKTCDLSMKDIYQNAICKQISEKYELGKYFRAVWGKTFRRELIVKHDICFPEDLYMGEDAVFLLRYISVIQSFQILPYNGYLYRILSSSAVRRYKSDLYDQSLKEEKYIRSMIEEKEDLTDAYIDYLWWMYFRLLENGKLKKASDTDCYEDAIAWYKLFQIKMKSTYRKNTYLKYKWRYLMAWKMPKLFILCHKISDYFKR